MTGEQKCSQISPWNNCPLNSYNPLEKIFPPFFYRLCFFVNFPLPNHFFPLLPSIQAEMHFSHSQAGHLFFFIALGGSLARISHESERLRNKLASQPSLPGIRLRRSRWRTGKARRPGAFQPEDVVFYFEG